MELFPHPLAIDLGSSQLRLLYSQKAKTIGKLVLTSLSAPIPFGSHFLYVAKYKKDAPLRGGTLANDLALERLLHELIRFMIPPLQSLVRPSVLLSIPATATPVEQRALLRSTLRAGFSHVRLIATPFAAALGVGVDVFSQEPHILLHLGEGRSELSFCRDGKLMVRVPLTFSSQKIATHLQRRIRALYGLSLSVSQAEQQIVRHKQVYMPDANGFISCTGTNTATSIPEEKEIPLEIIHSLYTQLISDVAHEIQMVVARVPASLTTSLPTEGILLTGGVARYPGISLLLSQVLKVPVSVMPDPELAVIRGMGDILSSVQWTMEKDDAGNPLVIGQ
jgi:rod shape-determining protein MreB and related proteins